MRNDGKIPAAQGSGGSPVRSVRFLVSALGLLVMLLFAQAGTAYADSCCNCADTACGCVATAHEITNNLIETQHEMTRQWITDAFKRHQDWMVDDFFKDHILRAMMMMTDQLTAVAMEQVEIIGMFLDAKHQLETQRLFQQLQAQAHKDYHPSEDICSFGTNIEALAASDRLAEFNTLAMSQESLQRQLLSNRRSSAQGLAGDRGDRVAKFKTTYCNPADNNNGLDLMCGNGGPADRRNNDVDYTRLVDVPLTLQVDYGDGNVTPNEEDVVALSDNLYGHDVFNAIPKETLKVMANQEAYLDARAIIAKRSVAQGSFNAMVGMKSRGSGSSQEFMAAILKELAVPDNEIMPLLGDHPSYFAQMELLTKKLYQNPDFYANLYDKPVNVARKGVAMQAIQLMQDRDMYRSQLRSEMLLSVMLEMEVATLQKGVQSRLDKLTPDGPQN